MACIRLRVWGSTEADPVSLGLVGSESTGAKKLTFSSLGWQEFRILLLGPLELTAKYRTAVGTSTRSIAENCAARVPDR